MHLYQLNYNSYYFLFQNDSYHNVCIIYNHYTLSPQWYECPEPWASSEGAMRAPNAEPGPEPTRPPVAWLPGPLDGGVCLRLRLSRHGDRARGRWHLVEPGADSRSVGKRPVNPDPQTGSSQSKGRCVCACACACVCVCVRVCVCVCECLICTLFVYVFIYSHLVT